MGMCVYQVELWLILRIDERATSRMMQFIFLADFLHRLVVFSCCVSPPSSLPYHHHFHNYFISSLASSSESYSMSVWLVTKSSDILLTYNLLRDWMVHKVSTFPSVGSNSSGHLHPILDPYDLPPVLPTQYLTRLRFRASAPRAQPLDGDSAATGLLLEVELRVAEKHGAL